MKWASKESLLVQRPPEGGTYRTDPLMADKTDSDFFYE
jgi:hypothetical protein